jgi:type IV pilus assembly protein PilB
MIDKKIVRAWVRTLGLSDEECDRLEQTAQKRNENILKIILEEKILPEEEVMDFLSAQLEIPTLNLHGMQFDPEVLRMFPRKFIEQHQVFPVGRIGKLVTVATSDPFKLRVFDDIKRLAGCDVNLVLVTPARIIAAISDHYAESKNFSEFITEKDADSLELVTEDEKESPSVVQDGQLHSRKSPQITRLRYPFRAL